MRDLARENQRLSSSQVLPKTGRDETEKMLKDITQQNAMLRRKLDDANQKIAALEKKWVLICRAALYLNERAWVSL